MLEAARLLGGISGIMLVAALATWLNLFRGPVLRPIDGRARLSNARIELGSQLLVGATGLSAVAAVLAVAGWIFA
jgi:hypothetical protein